MWLPHLYDGRKRKTFFFFSYTGIHNNAPVNQGFMTVPSALERQGDFSQTCFVNSGIIYGNGGCTSNEEPRTCHPALHGVRPCHHQYNDRQSHAPFAGNVIPSHAHLAVRDRHSGAAAAAGPRARSEHLLGRQ